MTEQVPPRLTRLPWSAGDDEERFLQLCRYAQVGRGVNSLTHDINNYLGAVIAYSELLGTDPGISEDSRQMLGKMLEAGEKCAHLIAALTNIARPDLLRVSSVDLSTVVRDVLLMRDYAMRNARISLETVIAADMPAVAGDAPKLQQAMIYLMMNAQEAIEGRPNPRILRVYAGREDDTLFFRVRDSGPGIPEEERDRIFDLFTSGKQGIHAGYGLPAARAIARLHRGDLTYAPECGFTLRIPLETGLTVSL